jgi:membrane protease YdiL (CAAX protease family)
MQQEAVHRNPSVGEAMENRTTWPLDVGTTGVLAAGRWLRLRAVLWAALLSAGALGFLFSTIDLRSWLNLPPNSSYVIFLVVPLLAFVTYAVVVRLAEARMPVEVLPFAGMLTELLIGATIGFITLCFTTASLWSLGFYQVQRSHWSGVLGSFLFGPYLSGTLEELLFRAILLRILARAFGNGWGLVLSAVLFGAAHLGHVSWIACLAVILRGGLVTGVLYMATGRLWMSIGLHTAWDFTEDFVLGVNKQHGILRTTLVAGNPELLTGGAFGPNGSLVAMIVGILACITIQWAARRGYFQRMRLTTNKRTMAA